MPPETELNLNQYLTFRLARVQAKLNAQAARMLHDVCGLSLAQWRVIAILGSQGDATSSSLSRLAEFDKGLLSRKLRTLIDAGLVTSTPHATDRRVQILSLSQDGRKLFKDTVPHTRKRQENLRALLTQEEVDCFFSIMDKFEAALEAET